MCGMIAVDHSDPDTVFRISVQCGPMAVRDILGEVTGTLSARALDMDEVGTVELVLAEALNNVVEHAYPDPDSAGQIRVHGLARDDGLHVTIQDQGVEMPNGHAPIGHAPSVDVDLPDLPEGGFGWFLIRDLAKDVAYERRGSINELRLRIAVNCAA